MNLFSFHNRCLLNLALIVSIALAMPLKPAAAMSSASWISILSSMGSSDDDTYADTEKKATQMLDAWAGYELVTSSVPGDASGELKQRYRKLAVFMAVKAIKQNSAEALTLMFSRNDVPEFNKLRPEYVNTFLSMAENSEGGKKDLLLLSAAGDVLDGGTLVTRDSIRAAALYARAWLAGNDKAPEKLARLFMEHLKDPASAYLWKLRCLNECYAVTIDVGEDFLSPRQIQWIQAQARDRSIITVNGLAAMKETR